jgi:6-phosphofructokinase 1
VGLFLKSVNKGHFAGKTGDGEFHKIDPELLNQAIKNYQKLGLEALVVLGGDGSMATASQFLDLGVNIIGVPKSIDNDLMGTDFTFGFNTAVEITTEALDRIATTAKSHDRIMILEVMGRHAGWISLYSGLSGGADMILLPEIPFDHQKVVDFFKRKYASGHTHGLIVVSEGAFTDNGKIMYKDLGDKSSETKLGGIGDYLEVLLNFEPELEARNTVLGHIQRGGSPNSWDRILSRSYGAYAGRMVREKKYGQMVGYTNGSFMESSIVDCLKQLKLVDPKGDFVERARELGVSFGDR